MQQLCRAVAASANHSHVTGAKHSTLTEQLAWLTRQPTTTYRITPEHGIP